MSVVRVLPPSETRRQSHARWAAAIVLTVIALHLLYLWSGWALNLTGDEAYYWEWSRRLDYGYYSKPPLVAWLIRASCEIFGDVMPAVRLPAVLLGGGSLAMGYVLSRRMYGAGAMALGVVGVMCAIPMLMAGSVLMTIDAPLFFLLAVATTGAAVAIFEDHRWGWALASITIFLAMLAKPAAAMWLIGPFAFLLTTPAQRRHLRAAGPYLCAAGCVLGLAPTLLWNIEHRWVTAHHVAHDLGGEGGHFLSAFLSYVVGQFFLGSPFVLAAGILAATHAMRSGATATAQRERFLLAVAAPFLVLPAVVTCWDKAQPNWTAPAYFSLAILATRYLAGLQQSCGRRVLVRGIIAFALLSAVFAHFGQILYPVARATNEALGTRLSAAKLDVGRRGRGWDVLGRELGRLMREMPPGTLIMAPDYQTTALATFYTAGHPAVYRYGTCLSPPTQHWSQYELWPDRLPTSANLKGKDFLMILPRESEQLRGHFGSIQLVRRLSVTIAGEEVRTLYIYHGIGFRGMSLNVTEATY